MKQENIELKSELDSIKTVIKKEEERKQFFGVYKKEKKEWIGYDAIEFKGETSVVVSNKMVALSGTYKRDGNIIQIDVSGQSLSLTIKDSKTLIGEDSFTEGIFTKQ